MAHYRFDDERILKFAAIFSDITERKRKEEQAFSLAYHDPSTQIRKRRPLTKRLRQSIVSAQRHDRKPTAIFLDQNLLKRINGTLEYDIGDVVLTKASRRLVRCLREGNTGRPPGR